VSSKSPTTRCQIPAARLAWALGLLLAVASCGKPGSETTAHQKVPTVTLVAPARRTLERRVTLTGDVLGIQQAELTAKVPGFIKQIYVDRGDFVHRGDLLAKLTYPEQEAAYSQAKANFELAEVNYRRALALLKEKVASQQDVDNATEAYKAARDNLAAQKTLYDYREIRAPFDGYIVQRNFDPGHLIMPSSGNTTPLFVIADISKVRIFIYVPEKDVGILRPGLEVAVFNDAYPGKTFTGQVTRIAQGLDPSTRTMQTEIDIINPEGELKPGMFARVDLALERRTNALTLPAGAVMHDVTGSYVYTVAGGRAHRVAVGTGWREGDTVEITRGLDDSQSVVLTGWEQLADDAEVRVAEPRDERAASNHPTPPAGGRAARASGR
jgi:membrane fusion protein, multidrug efflux system